MSELGQPADTPSATRNHPDVGELPAGTVTLLRVGFENSVRPAQTPSKQAPVPVEWLGTALAEVFGAYGGARLLEPGECDGFVVAFTRASDAIACALDLQRAPSAPIRLRIGLHSGEIQPGDTADRVGSALDRAARICGLAHAGQTLLSGVTAELVADRLPADAWLTELGSYPVRGVPHPERVSQLCHTDLGNQFPPLRVGQDTVSGRLPAQLTTFVGRRSELAELRRLVSEGRLVTLTGAGGVGKTRLAAQLIGELADGFDAGVGWVDLASITDPDLVAVAVAHSLGLTDQPGRTPTEAVIRLIAQRRMCLVLDNCEHLLGACATLATALLGACPGLTMVATSREPLGVAGELIWRTPSLSLADEAIELFTDRARLAHPEFATTADNAAAMAEICRRLDGVALAIELAAARVRALSPTEILASLQDRFRLLTGGARTAVRRQQTLRASVDWSYALLSEPERVMFRRLAPFLGGFDLAAAHAVAGDAEVPRYQVLDALTLLVGKSLVIAETDGPHTRYRLLETVRHYALEKLTESGEAAAVRTRHRDHYTALFDTPVSAALQQRIERAEIEIDNLRAAFTWSRDNSDPEPATRLASALQPLWLRGRITEGLAWFDAALADSAASALAVRARALADKTILDHFTGAFDATDQIEPALAIARDLGDPTLLAQVLTARGAICAFSPDVAVPYFDEAIDFARAAGDDWRLSHALAWRALSAYVAGDPVAIRAAAEEGRDLADAAGDGFYSRMCRWNIAMAQWMRADLVEAAAQFNDVAGEAQAAHDPVFTAFGLICVSKAVVHQGEADRARAAAEAALEVATGTTVLQQGASLGALADAFLAAGDAAAAVTAAEAAWQACPLIGQLAIQSYPMARAALASGDVAAARRWADDAVSAASGAHRMGLLATSARVAIAQGEVEHAERDAHDALAIAAQLKTYLTIADAIECLAALSTDSGGHREAARLFGAAQGIRERTGQVRFKVYDADYESSVAALRSSMEGTDFDASWADGAALSTDEAISYARSGHGERRRPAAGWTSLTPTEHDVVRFVGDGLSNKEIAARLFVSPRTVQTHLTHVYAKLGITSRVQLAQAATRHA